MSAAPLPGTKIRRCALYAALLACWITVPGLALALGGTGALVEAAKRLYADDRPEEAALLFERAARAGNRYAQYRYAMMLLDGSAQSRESNAVWRWLRRAAGAGLAQAQFEFALRYERGDLVSPSMPVAIEWYRRAASQGHTEAQVHLARLLLERSEQSGALTDRDQAVRWLGAAARSGHAAARAALQELEPDEAVQEQPGTGNE